MTTRKKNPTRSSRRLRVVVALARAEERQILALIDEAQRLEWDLVDIIVSHGWIPFDVPPDGALVDCLPSHPLVRRLRKMKCPVVRLGGRPHPLDPELPAVLPDLVVAGTLAAEHFWERGYEHVGFDASTTWAEARYLAKGLQDGASELGPKFSLLKRKLVNWAPGLTSDDAAEYAKRGRELGSWLSSLPKPVGVLSPSAHSVCINCLRLGLAVPDEVALLGVGNHRAVCELSPVPLSSVDMAVEEQATQAVGLLRSLMMGSSAPRGPLLITPRGIVVRRSTDMLAVGDPRVVRALRFMWEHLEQDLSVDLVAEEVGVPRRQLERAFQRELGRSINVELRRKRLEQLKELLLSTDAAVIDLVPRVGFRSATYLNAAFKRAFGLSPHQYRVLRRASSVAG